MKIDDKVLSDLIKQVKRACPYDEDNKTIRVSAAAWSFIRQEMDKIIEQEEKDKYNVEVKDED